MGRSVNKVQIIGTLGRDPEMKYLPSGSAVVTVSVATDESYNDKQTGQKVERTEWHRISAFGKLAEIIGQYLHKGSKAYFEGKLRTNEYEKDGIKRYSTEIVVNDMMMLDGRQNSDMGAGYGNTQPMGQSPSAAMGQSQPGAAPQTQQPRAPQAAPHQPQQAPAQQAPQQGYAPQSGYAPRQAENPAARPAQQPQHYQQPARPAAPQRAPVAPQPENNFGALDDDIPF